MKYILASLICISLLSSCTLSSTPSSSSGSVSSETPSPDVQAPLVETLSGTGNEFYPIFDGTGTKIIHAKYTAGK